MYKKTITYEDFDGNKRTEDFYFNLTTAEVAKMEMGVTGGYSALLKQIVESNNAPVLRDTFEKFIIDSYGEKSPDGKHFYKSPEITKEFMSTEAYSVLFMELCTDSKASSEFVRNVLPKNMAEQAEQAAKSGNLELVEPASAPVK